MNNKFYKYYNFLKLKSENEKIFLITDKMYFDYKRAQYFASQ